MKFEFALAGIDRVYFSRFSPATDGPSVSKYIIESGALIV